MAYKHSEETKQKMRKSRTSMLREKNPMWGRKRTLEEREKIRKTRLERIKEGKISPWNKGKRGISHHSEETKRKIREKMSGENNPAWKGGKTRKGHLLRTSAKYMEWRSKVFIRDNFRCRLCGSTMNLEVHHIVSIKEAPECITEFENGITFCKYCHAIVDKNRRVK